MTTTTTSKAKPKAPIKAPTKAQIERAVSALSAAGAVVTHLGEEKLAKPVKLASFCQKIARADAKKAAQAAREARRGAKTTKSRVA